MDDSATNSFDKYIVVYTEGGDDLSSQEFDKIDEAMAFINGAETGNDVGEYGCNGLNIGNSKSILIRAEFLAPPANVSVEDYT
jgi:hypothetical protein